MKSKTRATVRAGCASFRIEGAIPSWLLRELRKRYGRKIQIADKDEESIDIRESAWFKRTTVSPAEALRLLRQNRGLSQDTLARRLGRTVRKTHISDMELGRRGISKGLAKKLAAVLGTSVAHFI